MRTPHALAAGLGLLLSTSTALAAPTSWKIDPAHTRVGFEVDHMVISDVEGRFKEFSGEVMIDEANLAKSSVTFEVAVASVDTDNDKRDEHLRSPDFFHAQQHPKMTFKSTKIRKVSGKKFKVTGDLTIRGVTKPVTLDVELSKPVKNPWGQTVRAVSVEGKISRKDFGLTWNKALETGGVLVGEEVEIDIRMELNA